MSGTSYTRPETLDELFVVLAATGEPARILAGGTDVMVAARAGRQFPALVNVFRLEPLRGIAVRDGRLEIGAAVTVARLLRSAEVRAHALLLWQAADRFGSPLVRSRATIGGNLCNASPAADLSLALLALDAEVEMASMEGRRTLPVERFILGPGKTALRTGEVVTSVRLAIAEPSRFHQFEKSGARPALEISVAAVAASLVLEDGLVQDPRLACGAVAPVPMRARKAEIILAGRPLTPDVIEAASRAAAAEIRPIDDVRGTKVYRRRLVAAFVRRCLTEAARVQRLRHGR